MMQAIWGWLSQAIGASSPIAILAAFLWGILSILLSPCHLSSIPLIIGFINGQGNITTKRAFRLSLLFSIGILITIGLIGVITGLLGRMLGDVGKFGNYFVAVIFFLVGLYLLDVISLNFIQAPDPSKVKKRGLLAAFMLGLIFGLHGANPGDHIQHGGNALTVRHPAVGFLRHWPLLCNRSGRHIYRSSAALSALERRIKRGHAAEEDLRYPGHSRRNLSHF